MAGYMNNGGAYYNPYPSVSTGYPNYVQLQQMQNYQQMQQPQPQQTNGSNGLPYVHGIEGAHAFPMPQSVNRIILWDDTVDSFYIKGYDDMGKPKVLAWNDFSPHVEEKTEPTEPENPSEYVTKEYFDKVLRELKIGEKGRIVRSNEHDA